MNHQKKKKKKKKKKRYSISMLHTHATHAGPGERFDPSTWTWSRFEVSNATDEVVFTANVVCV